MPTGRPRTLTPSPTGAARDPPLPRHPRRVRLRRRRPSGARGEDRSRDEPRRGNLHDDDHGRRDAGLPHPPRLADPPRVGGRRRGEPGRGTGPARSRRRFRGRDALERASSRGRRGGRTAREDPQPVRSRPRRRGRRLPLRRQRLASPAPRPSGAAATSSDVPEPRSPGRLVAGRFRRSRGRPLAGSALPDMADPPPGGGDGGGRQPTRTVPSIGRHRPRSGRRGGPALRSERRQGGLLPRCGGGLPRPLHPPARPLSVRALHRGRELLLLGVRLPRLHASRPPGGGHGAALAQARLPRSRTAPRLVGQRRVRRRGGRQLVRGTHELLHELRTPGPRGGTGGGAPVSTGNHQPGLARPDAGRRPARGFRASRPGRRPLRRLREGLVRVHDAPGRPRGRPARASLRPESHLGDAPRPRREPPRRAHRLAGDPGRRRGRATRTPEGVARSVLPAVGA